MRAFVSYSCVGSRHILVPLFNICSKFYFESIFIMVEAQNSIRHRTMADSAFSEQSASQGVG